MKALTSAAYFSVRLPLAGLRGKVDWATVRAYQRQVLPRALRRSVVRPDTCYVFTFLGEFGYELFNWQGVVRKFARQLPASSRIVIVGRRGLEAFYETASQYLVVSDFPPYQESVAAGYFALPPDLPRRYFPPAFGQLQFNTDLCSRLARFTEERLEGETRRRDHIFSSQLREFPGCVFGVDRHFYGRDPAHPGKIYRWGSFDMVANNEYRRIEGDLSCQGELERALGLKLDQPFILVQARSRALGPQMGVGLPVARLVRELAGAYPVVLLGFQTGRAQDSSSQAEEELPARVYSARSFREQSCLIAKARHCVFVTEGDLGSHTYLPPFLGRHVAVVARRDLLAAPHILPSIDLWNAGVFRFGGHLKPFVAEEVFASDAALKRQVEIMLEATLDQSRS